MGIVMLLLMVFLAYIITKKDMYIFSGLFARKDENGNLVSYGKVANCNYCSTGKVYAQYKKINNKNKVLGVCGTCDSLYTLEKGDIGRHTPYIINDITINTNR